jgi:orotidine-5'-phosphate decarboxylase
MPLVLTSVDRAVVNPLLVALDVESAERALSLARELRDVAGGFKIGSRLFTLEGPSLVRRLADDGLRVFLDLKFHDIPNTVAQAVDAAVQTGAWMINVHAAGGPAMLQAAARAGVDAASRLGRPAPLLIAVTVLTSMDEEVLHGVGVTRSLDEHVIALARLAQDAGLAGVVASPREAADIRRVCGDAFAIVTPGIRGAGAPPDDQSRTMGPADAVAAGATHLVVGRPIIAAPQPRAAAEAIVEEIRAARAGHPEGRT